MRRAATAVRRCVLATAVVIAMAGMAPLAGQDSASAGLAAAMADTSQTIVPDKPLRGSTEEPWREALLALPIAAALGAALAFRPVRRGTPARDPAVIQTQIVLAIVGAVIMLVVGASLARAFGIVGAASLVRYRAKIEDPKDAAVMLVALSIGLASGVGIHLVAAICTLFILATLWVLESFEPQPKKTFELTVKSKDVGALRDGIEGLLRRNGVRYEIRTTSHEEVAYEVELPVRKRTDRLTNAICDLDPSGESTVEWTTPKKK